MDFKEVNWMKHHADLRVYKKCDGTVATFLDAVYVGIVINGQSASAWVLNGDYDKDFAVGLEEDATARLRWEKISSKNPPVNGKIPAQLSINGKKMRIYIIPENMLKLVNS